jgi:hypothetical protein
LCSARKAVLVIADDRIRPTRIPNGHPGNALLDTADAGGAPPVERPSLGTFTLEAFADGPDYGLGDCLTGELRELSRQPLGIGIPMFRANLCLPTGL